MQSYRFNLKTMRSYHFMRSIAVRLLLIALGAASAVGHAAERWGPACPSEDTSLQTTLPFVKKPPIDSSGVTYLHGEQLEARGTDVIQLHGDAELSRDGQRISADSLRYDQKTSQTDATGNVVVVPPEGGRFITNEAHFQLDSRTGYTDSGTYYLANDWGRGEMGGIEFRGAEGARLSQIRFTTCPEDENDWYLSASRLDIDTEEDIAVARNVTVNFLDVPIFYLPYLSFPTSNRRKSGFLMPEIGYQSTNGTILATPYYLNLAPEYDATLIPRWYSERGLQLGTEFRYLGEQHEGQLDADYLPDDKIVGGYRAAGAYTHRHRLSPFWDASVNLRGVSDRDYAADFSDDLQASTETHLPQNAEINYRGPIWTFTGRAAGYQTVDRSIAQAERPYLRLPQVLLRGDLPSTSNPALRYRMDSELVNFQREERLAGQRANIAPSVIAGKSVSWGFLTSEVGARHIGYSLNGTAGDEHPSVTAPFLNVDSGLFFERSITLGKTQFSHTLEPRVYYLYVPYRPQDDLPNFDTSEPSFTIDNLFRSNRFVGGDRIGDANQITLALTSRFIDDADGRERFRGSIGRVHYLHERRVNVPSGVIADQRSDIVAEAIAWLPRNWHARANIQWTPERESAALGSFYLQHQPAPNKILNLGYRLTRDELEQSDISFEWPLWGHWTASGRSIYSLRDSENVERYLGMKYTACCWAMRLFAAKRLMQTNSTSDQLTEQRSSIHFQLELSGLAQAGTTPTSPLSQGLHSFPGSPSPPPP